MYKKLFRPILFLIGPETIHHIVAAGLKIIFSIPGMSWVIKKLMTVNKPSLRREVFGLRFDNPVGIAAGFDKKGNLYNYLHNFGFGHVEIGTVTPRAQKGNPKPRLFRVPPDKALINRMGFNNPGIETFVKNLRRNKPKLIIGCNIGKNTDTPNEKAVDDYCAVFEALYPYVDYFVVNISCPNIKDLDKLQDSENTKLILENISKLNTQKPVKRPILLKISPDLNEKQLDDLIEVVNKVGIDGIVATNTTTTRNNLSLKKEKIEAIGSGGLSGLPLKDKSTQIISYISKKSDGKLPVIGVGGIFTPEDALEKLNAGATLIQVYTGFIYEGPFIARKINRKLT